MVYSTPVCGSERAEHSPTLIVECGTPVNGIGVERKVEPPHRVQRYGRYLLLEEIGRGGVGSVYTAYDPDLHRKVAVKVIRAGIHPGWGHHDDTVAKRMLREAQAMAQLSHENVVPIYDVGIQDEQIYLTMELIEGPTLRQWIRSAPRTPIEIRDVFLGAARGLHAAHRVGLVHRDFKPQNVMLHPSGHAKVLDFGLARQGIETQSRVENVPENTPLLINSDLTDPSILLGTPQYMAPEQLANREVGPVCVLRVAVGSIVR